MKEQVINDDLARRFLLGQLSADQQGQIQELAFEDPDTFALLESVEDDLIDEFIQDELSPDEKQHFKNHFLTLPGRKANLKMSRVLQHHFSRELPQPVLDDKRISFFGLFTISPQALRISLTAAALLIGLAIAVWLYQKSREVQQPGPVEVRKEQSSPSTPGPVLSPTIEPTPQLGQIDKNKTPAPQKPRPEALVAVLMPSEGVRGDSQPLALSQKQFIPVELPLINQPAYQSYEADLQSEDGKVLKTWPSLHAKEWQSGTGLLITIPRVLLEPDEFYQLSVRGKAADGSFKQLANYPFQAKE